MEEQEVYSKIKSVVHSFLPGAQVLLFGSRARGVAHKDSDYDLLVVTEKSISPKEKMNLQSKINKALAWALEVPFDLLLKDTSEVERYKNAKAHIIYYALKEAVKL